MDVTLREMIGELYPIMNRDQIRTLTALAGIEPTGIRHTGRAGRPAHTYDATLIRNAHATEAARSSRPFEDTDWIAFALLGRHLIRVNPRVGAIWWRNGERAEVLGNGGYGWVRVGPTNLPAHRIIWIADVGEIPVALQVNHINHLRWDNRRVNLDLVTQRHNLKHRDGEPYLTYHQAIAELAVLPPAAEPGPWEALMDKPGAEAGALRGE
jgi:hypothetical protein